MKLSISVPTILLAVAASSAGFPADHKPKPNSVDEKLSDPAGALFLMSMDLGVGLGLDSLPYLTQLTGLTDKGGDAAREKDVKRYMDNLRNFPDELVESLKSRDSKRQSLVMERFVAEYAIMVRTFAKLWGDDGDDVIRVAFGRHVDRVKAALEIVLDTAKQRERVTAAAVLLQLAPGHERALGTLLAAFKNGDAALRVKACEMAGGLVLSQPEVVASVVAAVSDRDFEVRRAAAHAVSKFGPRASKAAPGLIELLSSGDEAYMDVRFKYAITLPKTSNIALLALGALGKDGQDAIPTIRRMLGPASRIKRPDDNTLYFGESVHSLDEMLVCLTKLGPKASAAVPDLRRLLVNSSEHRLHVAAALLCFDAEDQRATEFLQAGLTAADKVTRRLATQACSEIGPKSKALVPALCGLLKDPDRVSGAAEALGKMGPIAKDAIPALITVLSDERNSEGIDFITRSRAGFALAGIGKASVPALVRVLRNRDLTEGREDAAWALGLIGADAASAVPALIEAAAAEKVEEWLVGRNAILALGMMKSSAAAAREPLTRLTQHRYVGCVAVWALTQLSR